ncbi:transmembrane protein 115 [Strongylocentrotus purpuratus]|uniref:Transmembrane protein 115 n=1 Tax=Strongylocentrotus purpuratus TaxID=7668 RepID=A0A7M7TG83_STRPU|nr:transmembrane protein 115 [Strongylocentrotus purpuratus]
MATSATTAPAGVQQIQAVFMKSSVVVKSICGVIIFLYFISFLVNNDKYLEALAVTPGLIFPPSFRVWTLFTHPFIEVHLWLVLHDVALVLLCGRLIEPLWSALEMLIFFAIVTVGSAIITSFLYLFMYLSTVNITYLFDTHIFGLAGYAGAVTIALKQSMGDGELPPKVARLRVHHLPVLLLVSSFLLRFIGIVPPTHPFMILTGMLTGWVYLRFYQRQTDGSRGDMADTFSFASFFPEVIRPFVAILANTVHSVLVKIKVCKKQIRKYDVGAPSPITISLPGTDPADAERRRQIALKALNERLSKVEEQTAWPSMDDQLSSTDPASPAPSSVSLMSDANPKDSVEINLDDPRSSGIA